MLLWAGAGRNGGGQGWEEVPKGESVSPGDPNMSSPLPRVLVGFPVREAVPVHLAPL